MTPLHFPTSDTISEIVQDRVIMAVTL